MHPFLRSWRAAARVVLAFLPALACLACDDGATGPAALRDQVVFVSSRDQPGPTAYFRGIYAIRAADGGGMRRLAAGYDKVLTADVSPDGRQLTFSNGLGLDGDTRVYVGAAAGRSFRRLTTVDQIETAPAWSPDGRRIAFACRTRYADSGALCLANADGTGYRVVYAPNAGQIFDLTWLPAGDRIVFEEELTSFTSRYMAVNADGSGLAAIPLDPSEDGLPTWSSDGQRMVFSSVRDSGSAIYVANADGSSISRLTALGSRDAFPHWSPDGSRIVFSSRRGEDGQPDVYVMRADGSDQRNLTASRGVFDSYPSWGSDR